MAVKYTQEMARKDSSMDALARDIVPLMRGVRGQKTFAYAYDPNTAEITRVYGGTGRAYDGELEGHLIVERIAGRPIVTDVEVVPGTSENCRRELKRIAKGFNDKEL
jgi:hypothetical protein